MMMVMMMNSLSRCHAPYLTTTQSRPHPWPGNAQTEATPPSQTEATPPSQTASTSAAAGSIQDVTESQYKAEWALCCAVFQLFRRLKNGSAIEIWSERRVLSEGWPSPCRYLKLKNLHLIWMLLGRASAQCLQNCPKLVEQRVAHAYISNVLLLYATGVYATFKEFCTAMHCSLCTLSQRCIKNNPCTNLPIGTPITCNLYIFWETCV